MVKNLRKLLFSMLFIGFVLLLIMPNNPDIARNETFEDIPLVIIDSTQIVNVSGGNLPYLNIKGGIKLKGLSALGKLVKM